MGEVVQFPRKPLAAARPHVQAGATANGMLDLYDHGSGAIGIEGCVPWPVFFAMTDASGTDLGFICGDDSRVLFDAAVSPDVIARGLAPAKAAGVVICCE